MNLMPTCKEVQEHLTEWMEGDLPLSHRLRIRLHLMMCAACRSFLDGLRALPSLSKRLLQPSAESNEKALHLLDRVQRVLKSKSSRT